MNLNIKLIIRLLLFTLSALASTHLFAETLDPSKYQDVQKAFDAIMTSNGGSSYSFISSRIKQIVMGIALAFGGWAIFGLYQAYAESEIDAKGIIFMGGRLLLMLLILAALITL